MDKRIIDFINAHHFLTLATSNKNIPYCFNAFNNVFPYCLYTALLGLKPTDAYWGTVEPDPLKCPYDVANWISWFLFVDGSISLIFSSDTTTKPAQDFIAKPKVANGL